LGGLNTNMKRVILVAVLALSFGVIAYFLTLQTNVQKGAVPISQTQLWKGVLPGKTTITDVYQTLGPPLVTLSTADTTTLAYPTTNEHWSNDISVRQGGVVFIKERIFPLEAGSYEKRKVALTSSPVQLFGPDSNINIFLFVYLNQGIALSANPISNTLYEVWYFPPTDITGFLSFPETKGFSVTPIMGSDI